MTNPMPPRATFAVSGVSFRQDAVRGVDDGDVVHLIPDPTNPHDGDAISVVTPSGTLLGYVPASLTPRLHATGDPAHRGVVTEVLRGETWGLRVSYRGALQDAPQPPGHVPAAPPQAAAQVDGDRVVRTRSGRILGDLAGVRGAVTLVAVRGGGVVPYPSAVVEVVERHAA